MVVFGTSGKAVRLWAIATGKELPSLGGHSAHARRCAFSRDGSLVVTAGQDPFVLVRDWPSGKLRRRIDLEAGRHADRVAFTADGKRLRLVLWGDEAARFYDLQTGREVQDYPEAHTGQVFGLAVTPDGQVVSAGQDDTLRVWDLATGRQVRQVRTGHRIGAMTMSASADGRLIATGEVNEGVVRLFDRDNGRQVRTVTAGESVRTARFGDLPRRGRCRGAEQGRPMPVGRVERPETTGASRGDERRRHRPRQPVAGAPSGRPAARRVGTGQRDRALGGRAA
jgi:WD40 repeat protein